MVFKSDRQRKGFFAKGRSSTRTFVIPTLQQTTFKTKKKAKEFFNAIRSFKPSRFNFRLKGRTVVRTKKKEF